MTNFFNKSLLLSAVAALAATVVSCHKEESVPDKPNSRRIEVRIAAPATRGGETTTRSAGEGLPTNPAVEVGGGAAEMPQTRLAFEEDGATMRWTKGDRIALWGYNGGSAAFENETFTLWYPREDPSQGLFTGKVNAMAAGTYDYYAACPAPEATAGTQVSYTIPEVQDGRWHSDLDIMLARTTGTELREEILNDVTLRFAHKVHALKITIPEGRNLLGRPIAKMRIEFNRPVAGRLTWDLTNPDAAPLQEQTATAVTLAFDTPVDEGDTFWVYLAPVDLTGGEVQFVATDGEEFSWPLSTWNFRDCAAGRITPVKLTVDELRPQHRYIVTVDPAHLGEPVTQIDSITMPAGYQFPSLEPCLITRDVTANADGTFSIKAFADQAAVLSGGMEVGMGVGSENTEGVYGKHCTVSSPTADGCTVMSPYLLSEDFCDIADHSTENAANLSDWGLPNWSGARSHTDPGNCIVATCHVNSHSGITDTRYKGRIDTSCLPIRNGKNIDVKVSFDLGYDNHGGVEGSKAVATCTFGRTDTAAADTAVDANADFSLTVFSEKQVSKLSDSSNLPDKLADQIVSGCTSSSRLSWQIYTYKSSWFSGITNVDYDCYIDNIQVTIVH